MIVITFPISDLTPKISSFFILVDLSDTLSLCKLCKYRTQQPGTWFRMNIMVFFDLKRVLPDLVLQHWASIKSVSQSHINLTTQVDLLLMSMKGGFIYLITMRCYLIDLVDDRLNSNGKSSIASSEAGNLWKVDWKRLMYICSVQIATCFSSRFVDFIFVWNPVLPLPLVAFVFKIKFWLATMPIIPFKYCRYRYSTCNHNTLYIKTT